MSDFRVIATGMLGENCYLVRDAAHDRLFIVDPGDDADLIISAAREMNCAENVILLTHAHVDHIWALGDVARQLKVEAVRLDPADLPLYKSPSNQLPLYLPAARDLPETVAELDCPGMKTLSLPGHTPGGAGYYFPEQKWLFSGDTIFELSVGRTDLPGGDWPTLQRSIREVIYRLPDDTTIFCGHGDPTSVGAEKRGNPYVR